jgi:NADPH:quinone reductase-like Zn-dependent oxidoreductase
LKAVRVHQRAGPEGLVYEEAPLPTIGRGDALIGVYAAGITPTEFTWNSTFTDADKKSRLPSVPAFEVSGKVSRVAPGVAELAPGDDVYGLLNFWRDGSAAEYVAVKASDMAPKPKSLDFVQAAAVPLSGLTAWQALFDHAKLSQGQRVLIHGAGGGVGTFAVQFARHRGVRVVATCSASKADLVRELGAEEVIDYAKVRFEDAVRDVDAVLDTVGGDTLDRSWKVVRKGGTLVTIVGDAPEGKADAHGIRGVSMLVEPSRTELVQISRLIDEGEVRPIISGVFPLAEARRAYESGLSGHARGKVVLKVRAA